MVSISVWIRQMPDQYAFLTRSSPKTLQTVLEAVDAALSYPQLTVKINCVPMRGINEENLRDLADKAKDRPLAVRFIEMMPLGQGCGFEPVPEDEVKQKLGISGTMSEKTGRIRRRSVCLLSAGGLSRKDWFYKCSFPQVLFGMQPGAPDRGRLFKDMSSIFGRALI